MPVDRVAFDGLLIGAEGRGRDTQHPGLGKTLKDPLPGWGHIVVTLVDEDEIEEVVGERRQPALCPLAQLVDIRDNHVRLVAVTQIRVGVQRHSIRATRKVSENTRLPKETVCTADIHRVRELPLDCQIWGDHEHSAPGDAEREDGE